MYCLCFRRTPQIVEIHGPRRPLCLVIEDDPLCRSFAQTQLRSLGLDVIAVATGREAMLQIDRCGPSIVFIDNCLPDGDGCSLAHRIRKAQRRERPAPLLVALSAHTGSVHTRRCLGAGIDRVLSKPASLRSLALAIGMDLDMDLDLETDGQGSMVVIGIPSVAVVATPDLPGALRALYRAHCLLDFASLKLAVQAGDWKLCSQYAHRIRGSSQVVGAPVIAGVASVLEHTEGGSAVGLQTRLRAVRLLEQLLSRPQRPPGGPP